MKLGPIQEAWVKSLEEHPERQMAGSLGEITSGDKYRACCLGEALCVMHALGHRPSPFQGRDIYSYVKSGSLDKLDWQLLGLRGEWGNLGEPIMLSGVVCDSLAQANDRGVTWPKIAASIRANPEKVFTKSV